MDRPGEPTKRIANASGRAWASDICGALTHMLAGRWTLAVLAQLANTGRRYQELYEALDGISYKMLTETLRRAERDELTVRHLDPERVETATLYELTELGRSLDVPLAALTRWADINWQSVEEARRHWDQLRGPNS